MPDLPCNRLVDREPGSDVGGAFLQAHAGQEHAIAARVIASAVRAAVSGFLIQSAEDLKMGAKGLERLQGPADLVILAFTFGPPGGGNRAVGKSEKRRSE